MQGIPEYPQSGTSSEAPAASTSGSEATALQTEEMVPKGVLTYVYTIRSCSNPKSPLRSLSNCNTANNRSVSVNVQLTISATSSVCFHRRRLSLTPRNANVTGTEVKIRDGISAARAKAARMTSNGTQMRFRAKSSDIGVPVISST